MKENLQEFATFVRGAAAASALLRDESSKHLDGIRIKSIKIPEERRKRRAKDTFRMKNSHK